MLALTINVAHLPASFAVTLEMAFPYCAMLFTDVTTGWIRVSHGLGFFLLLRVEGVFLTRINLNSVQVPPVKESLWFLA